MRERLEHIEVLKVGSEVESGMPMLRPYQSTLDWEAVQSVVPCKSVEPVKPIEPIEPSIASSVINRAQRTLTLVQRYKLKEGLRDRVVGLEKITGRAGLDQRIPVHSRHIRKRVWDRMMAGV